MEIILTERDLKLAGCKPLKEGFSDRHDGLLKVLEGLSIEMHRADRGIERDAIDYAIVTLEEKQ